MSERTIEDIAAEIAEGVISDDACTFGTCTNTCEVCFAAFAYAIAEAALDARADK